MSSSGGNPRQVEVPVRRVEVTITLQQVLDALAQHAGSTAAGGAGQALAPAVADHVQRLGQLAMDMTAVLGELEALDPDVHAHLQGRE